MIVVVLPPSNRIVHERGVAMATAMHGCGLARFPHAVRGLAVLVGRSPASACVIEARKHSAFHRF